MNRLRVPWAVFQPTAFPIIDAFFHEHGRSPTSTWLRNHGHGWIVSAAYHYYGDYPAMLKRLGFPRATRPMIHRPGHRPQGYWMCDANIRRELAATFPELISWEIMPSIHMIQDRLPGLGSRILRVESLRSLAKRLELQLYWVGCRHRRRVEGIAYVLSFYQQHHRWPHASECPSSVRAARFKKGTTWHDFCRPTGQPITGLSRLIALFHEHRRWLVKHQPHKVLTRQRVLNHLIIEKSRRFPPLS